MRKINASATSKKQSLLITGTKLFEHCKADSEDEQNSVEVQ